MDLENLVILIVVGFVAGWLAGKLMKTGLGILGNIIVGVAGAFLGKYLFGILGISIASGLLGLAITAFIGAVVVLFLLSLLKK